MQYRSGVNRRLVCGDGSAWLRGCSVREGVSLEDANDLTLEIHALVVAEKERFRLGPLFTPPSLHGTLRARERAAARLGRGGGGRPGDRRSDVAGLGVVPRQLVQADVGAWSRRSAHRGYVVHQQSCIWFIG